ncbi:MAG: M28 family peptidase, partial [Bacteroidetes bacterium]|nr:M28 family peptidase [Bacteroidota bacterium]
VQVDARTDLHTAYLNTRNVVAMIPGSDPTLQSEYLVLGAHFDHLGMGGKGTNSREADTLVIHNGADDNASGTALMIELAEKFTAHRDNLRRSLLFVAFSGEEMGLLGSKHFVNHPPVGVENMKAMFNFDMVGRLDREKNTLTISGSGTSLEGDSILDVKALSYPFKLNHSKGGSGGSDHASFYGKNIPVFFFFSGMHTDYHKSTDDIEKINFDGMKMIGDFAFESILEIANMDKPLTFRESSASDSRNGNFGMKVRLGIMPDISATDQIGLGVDGVTPGLPAEKAGIQKGDRIISMDGQEIRNIQEYMARMSRFKQGQTIPVEIIRNSEKMTLTVNL